MSWEQRNTDFCKAQTDVQMAYIEAEREVDRLQAENAKLRNEVNNLLDFEHLTSVAVAYAGCDECGEYKQTMLRLFAENDKLRELVDILCFCMQIRKRCDDCKLNGAKGELGHDPLLACDGLHEMLKELGIEVG